jgi:hypothetical protein
MLSKEYFYTIEPEMKQVSKAEFIDFINNYPRKLERDFYGVCEPPLITYNDFELANRWPYSIVAKTWVYEDEPGHYYYVPEEGREYIIMANYEECFNSKTGNQAGKGGTL